MTSNKFLGRTPLITRFCFLIFIALHAPTWSQTAGESGLIPIKAGDCSAENIGPSIATELIGEPVSAVALSEVTWADASNTVPAHCLIKGSMAPMDKSDTAQAIQFAVALPSEWNGRAIQMGGGGMNGRVPRLTGSAGGFRGPSVLLKGYATYGSDSGHARDRNWLLNDEAIKNLGYQQMKKTHDAAIVIIQRVYGKKPDYNYYIGNSQGGREALTVAQRYPEDYDGISAGVPIVNFTALMQSPTLVRIQERKLENWVSPVKGKAIAAEFMRQCDGLDGLVDGEINNYVDCRARFNVYGNAEQQPWSKLRCPNNRDPNPNDNSEKACLSDAHIETLNYVFSTREFSTPVANKLKTFGMWAPTMTVAGQGMGQLFTDKRYKGQEDAAADAPLYTTLGVEGVTGLMMQDYKANPLDYDASGKHHARRLQISEWLDSTDPDLRAFQKRGGKMMVMIGTDDAIASSGAQLDYYQAVLDEMGRDAVDEFARLYVLPQTGHALQGTRYTTDGEGNTQPAIPLPSTFDRLGLLVNWVEQGQAPGKTETVTGNDGDGLMCSYPSYPHYDYAQENKGEPNKAKSYQCSNPKNIQ